MADLIMTVSPGINVPVPVDDTLSIEGEAADAAAVGAALALKADTLNVDSDFADVWADMANKLTADDVVNDLETDDDNAPLSAAMGKYLNEQKIDNDAEAIKVAILDLVYPIGSIYQSMVNTSPADFIGGTWTAITGTFLYAADSTHTVTSSAITATGGSETVTLTEAQIPAHNHGEKQLNGAVATNNLAIRYNGANASLWASYEGIISSDGNSGSDKHYVSSTKIESYSGIDKIKINATHTHNSVGQNQAHNNMPPYMPVYAWKRTA